MQPGREVLLPPHSHDGQISGERNAKGGTLTKENSGVSGMPRTQV